jgi:hypothetical protein
MRINESTDEYLKKIGELNNLKNTHPNISNIWIDYLNRKRNEYLMSLYECETMFNIISQYKVGDLSQDNIISLQIISKMLKDETCEDNN